MTFKFRKTKLFPERDWPGIQSSEIGKSRHEQTLDPGAPAPGSNAAIADGIDHFRAQYRLYGAVTGLDQRQRFGNYFDFFWRVKRPADCDGAPGVSAGETSFLVQAREISYPTGRTAIMKTEFAIIGDDYLDDGRVIAWRCLLIENGQIVAENRSYLGR